MTTPSILTMRERREYRKGLKELEKLVILLEDDLVGKKQIDENVSEALEKITNTSDRERQFAYAKELYKQLDEKYDYELKYAGQFKLSHFCEYIARDEYPAPHHEFMIDRLEKVADRDILRLMISMPPGHAKSTYSSHRFPAWYLGRFPNHKWLQAAHTMDFARNRLGKPVRSIISSERYKDIFPEVGLSHDSAAADFFEFGGYSGYYKAVGVGVGVAGYRADIQAVDDPFKSREDAESKTIRDKVFDWYSADFTTRMARKDMPQFVVATRWHPDDLCGRLEEMNEQGKGIPFEIVNLPAIAGDDDPLGRKPGEPLWDNFPLEILQELKSKLPGRDWNSLYQGNPVDEEGGTLTRDDVYRYDRLPEDIVRGGQLVKKNIRRVVLSVDCAEKDTQRSDYTAATIWVESADKKHYLKHAARIRAGFNQIVDFIDYLAESHNVDAVLCEDRGAGTQYIQVRSQQRGPAPVIAINTKQQDKSFRFDGVTPMFTAREVFLPKDGTEWIADVEAEIFAFPVGRHDDYVDSISQYLNWSRGDRVQRGVRKLMGTGLHA